MNQDIRKTAVLAMLAPEEAEMDRLERDAAQIFALTAELADVPPSPDKMDGAVTRESLRPDTAGETDTDRRCIRLSKNEKEGFVRVARTVG